MSLLWEILVGILWQFDAVFNNLQQHLVLPVKIALILLAVACGLYASWRLGARDIQASLRSLTMICVLSTPVLLLGAGQGVWTWALSLPVCCAALWAGNASQASERWAARGLWLGSFLAPALVLSNGPVAALILSCYAWTTGWMMRKLPINHKEWQYRAAAPRKHKTDKANA